MQTLTQNLATLARTLLVAIGSYLVGHSLFGIAIDSSNWQIIIGTIMALGGAGWGIIEKTATIESVESAVRSAIVSGSGLLVAAGKLSENAAIQIIGIFTALMPLIQSALSKAKGQQVAQKTIAPNATTGKMITMPKLPLIIGFMLLSSALSAQGLTKTVLTSPVPKAKAYTLVHKLDATSAPVDILTASDSILNTWRPIASIAVYIEPGNIAAAGVGISYQHLKYLQATQKWTCVWSVSPMVFGGGSVVPSTPAQIISEGILFGFDNNLIMVGPVLNGTKLGFAVSIGISLNN